MPPQARSQTTPPPPAAPAPAGDEGDLPEGWASVRLGDMSTLINGDRGTNYPSKDAFVQTGVPFINAGHLVDGIIAFSDMNYITEDRFQILGSGKVKTEDILYCLRGSLGKAAIVGNIDRGAIASSLVIIRPNDSGLPKYVYFFLVGPLGKDEILKYDNGSAQPNLSAKSVQDFALPLPPWRSSGGSSSCSLWPTGWKPSWPQPGRGSTG